MIWGPSDVRSLHHWFCKWRVAFGLLLAIGVGSYLVYRHSTDFAATKDPEEELHWGDFTAVAITVVFMACNLFLLFHYGQINLWHKQDDFEQHLDKATKERESIEKEMRELHVLGRSVQVPLATRTQAYGSPISANPFSPPLSGSTSAPRARRLKDCTLCAPKAPQLFFSSTPPPPSPKRQFCDLWDSARGV